MTKYERINRKFETLFFPRIKKPIQDKINSLSAVVDTMGVHAGISYLNQKLTIEGLTLEVQRIYEVVGVRHANDVTRGLKKQPIIKKGFGFNDDWVRFIQLYLQNHLIENITFNVNKTLRDYLLRVLQTSISEGWGIDETVRELRGSGFSDMQAARIVRTEVNTAANVGVIAAGETYDYEMQKKWISVHDFRTRGQNPKDHANHISLDGTTIDFEDVFVDPRNGDRLKHPGDPSASAASIINCRCNMALKPKRDSRGRLIPKRKTTSVIYPNQIRRGRIITI
jgi:hypothetical protein